MTTTTTPTTTIQSLANEILSTRNSVKSDRTPGLSEFIIFDDDKDPWMVDLFRDAHGDMLPDDWRFEFIDDALQLIGETDLDDDEDMIRERFDEWIDGTYIYNWQITGWLHSRADRYYYVNDWMQDVGTDREVIRSLSGGMCREAREVFDSVLQSLRNRVGTLCAEAEDEALKEEEA